MKQHEFQKAQLFDKFILMIMLNLLLYVIFSQHLGPHQQKTKGLEASTNYTYNESMYIYIYIIIYIYIYVDINPYICVYNIYMIVFFALLQKISEHISIARARLDLALGFLAGEFGGARSRWKRVG